MYFILVFYFSKNVIFDATNLEVIVYVSNEIFFIHMSIVIIVNCNSLYPSANFENRIIFDFFKDVFDATF
jgi:uncharacterized membrane protein